jgi:hypothetical protein
MVLDRGQPGLKVGNKCKKKSRQARTNSQQRFWRELHDSGTLLAFASTHQLCSPELTSCQIYIWAADFNWTLKISGRDKETLSRVSLFEE